LICDLPITGSYATSVRVARASLKLGLYRLRPYGAICKSVYDDYYCCLTSSEYGLTDSCFIGIATTLNQPIAAGTLHVCGTSLPPLLRRHSAEHALPWVSVGLDKTTHRHRLVLWSCCSRGYRQLGTSDAFSPMMDVAVYSWVVITRRPCLPVCLTQLNCSRESSAVETIVPCPLKWTNTPPAHQLIPGKEVWD